MNRILVTFIAVFIMMFGSGAKASDLQETLCEVVKASAAFGWNYQTNGRSMTTMLTSAEILLTKNFGETPSVVELGMAAASRGYKMAKRGDSEVYTQEYLYGECMK